MLVLARCFSTHRLIRCHPLGKVTVRVTCHTHSRQFDDILSQRYQVKDVSKTLGTVIKRD